MDRREPSIDKRDLAIACGIAALLGLILLVTGCGGGSRSEDHSVASHDSRQQVVGEGSKLRDCDITFAGPGPTDWRLEADWIGPFGVAGRGPGPDFGEGGFDDRGLYSTKTPTMVEGHRAVTISLAPGETRRAGLLGVHPKRAYASITYVPCPDKPRTVFPAGFVVRDRRPVLLTVEVEHGPVRSLAVGGSGHAREAEVAPRASALRAAVVRGFRHDFHTGTGVGPADFPACFGIDLGRALTVPRLTQLVSVYRRQGQPYATQALSRLAVPIGDDCGGRQYVPELIYAAHALGDRHRAAAAERRAGS